MLKARRKSAMIRAPFLLLTCPGGRTHYIRSLKEVLLEQQPGVDYGHSRFIKSQYKKMTRGSVLPQQSRATV